MDALADVPALVLGRGSDVLAWNQAGHALFAGRFPGDPSLASTLLAHIAATSQDDVPAHPGNPRLSPLPE